MTEDESLKYKLIDNILEINKLEIFEIDRILSVLYIKKVSKKDFVIEPGQVSKHMRFIAKGSVRVYLLDQNSQEHTLQLGIENWWINDLLSYLTQTPSRMFVQATEDTILIQIHRDTLEILYSEIPSISDFFRRKAQNAYAALQERTLENISLESYERYLNFIANHKNLEQRFPQYVIASYLGMTPEFLSYLRKKHAKDLP